MTRPFGSGFVGGRIPADVWDWLFRHGEGPEIAYVFMKVFWPDLVEVDGFVFLSQQYDSYRYRYQQILDDYGPPYVEEHINTVYLDHLFGVWGIAREQLWNELGPAVARMWKCRAESSFPSKKFISKFAWYSDIGDPAVTLYQAKWVTARRRLSRPSK